jgi:hypothetical protein
VKKASYESLKEELSFVGEGWFRSTLETLFNCS